MPLGRATPIAVGGAAGTLADKTSKWAERLHDERGGRVVFLAHCPLNANTRYPAFGFEVLGIIGVDASPSCGVPTTMNVERAFVQVGRLGRTATTLDINAIVRGNGPEGSVRSPRSHRRTRGSLNRIRVRKAALNCAPYDCSATKRNRSMLVMMPTGSLSCVTTNR
jgi:hypothetical protein